MNSLLFSICFVDIISISISSPITQTNNGIKSFNHHLKKDAFQIQDNAAETQLLKIKSFDGQFNNKQTSIIDIEKLYITSQYNATTIFKSYIRDDWSIIDFISNSLTFGKLPMGNNSHIKLILSLLLFLCLLILMLLCYYKLFITYCYKPVYITDNV